MNREQFVRCQPQRGRRFYKNHLQFGYRRPKYNVPVNVIENSENFEVHVFATGFDKENIRITVTNDVLFISGTRNVPESYAPGFTLQEFPVRSFERSLALNGKVELNGITARQENGVLIIDLPKNESAKSEEKSIPVV